MRVLWFSNTPANSGEYLNEKLAGGGWLKSLDLSLQTKVELHIAFYYPKSSDSFTYLNTNYYPIGSRNWKIKAVIGVFFQRLLDKQDLPKYLEIIRVVNPDIIHIHGTENPFGCIIPYVNVPVVLSIQGCISVIYHKYKNGFSGYYLRQFTGRFKKSLMHMLFHKSFFQIWKEFEKSREREQRNLKQAKFIIGRTTWDKRISSILAPNSVYFHCNEILREVFYKQHWKFHKSNKLIIHTTSGNSPIKGFMTVCEALNALLLIPDLEVEWQLAGISADDTIVSLTKRTLKKKFPVKGLVYLGIIDESDLMVKLCDAHIYVSPSHIENSSNSLSEAMLIGMPCVATFAGGTGSLLTDGQEGILVQDGDPWALAGAILELYRNPHLAIQYGRKAREKALLRHNQEKIVADLLNIYKAIITREY